MEHHEQNNEKYAPCQAGIDKYLQMPLMCSIQGSSNLIDVGRSRPAGLAKTPFAGSDPIVGTSTQYSPGLDEP
jgi:hypothetical protein